MVKKIGQVLLDYEHYSGSDLYSDGEIEDTLLMIAKDHEQDEFRRITEEQANWPVFYHMSALRANIVEWLPITKESKVLEVGSGPGAITGILAKKAGSVTCVELSEKRSLINAYRNRECDNVVIKIGNFKDVEPGLSCDYDFVILIGVFEYGRAYMGGDTPYEDFLKILHRHKKNDGRMIIAIENRLGLKYLAGAKEDHNGRYFGGIEGYCDCDFAATFSVPAMKRLLDGSKIGEYHFFYPYPDYKFMHTVYSDRMLPTQGELFRNIRNFDRDRMLLFDERKAYDAAIEEGIFPLLSNSYMVIAGPDVSTVYARYSTDRDDAYAIVTEIRENEHGKKYVVKRPFTDAAKAHLVNMERAGKLLESRYSNTGLTVLKPERNGEELWFPYIDGVTLEQMLDTDIMKNKKEEALGLIGLFFDRISVHPEHTVCNQDFNFDNIIVSAEQTQADQKWYLIDYEWTKEEALDPVLAVRRALYCFCLGRDNRSVLLEWLSASEWGKKMLPTDATRADEFRFQRATMGEHISTQEIRDRIGNAIIPVRQLAQNYIGRREKSAVQLYWDMGNGFSEENSSLPLYNQIPLADEEPDQNVEEGDSVTFTFMLPAGSSSVRIDPARSSCIVWLETVTIDDKPLPAQGGMPWNRFLGTIRHNGRKIGQDRFFFSSVDPHFQWGLRMRAQEAKLTVHMHVTMLSSKAASAISRKMLL